MLNLVHVQTTGNKASDPRMQHADLAGRIQTHNLYVMKYTLYSFSHHAAANLCF